MPAFPLTEWPSLHLEPIYISLIRYALVLAAANLILLFDSHCSLIIITLVRDDISFNTFTAIVD